MRDYADQINSLRLCAESDDPVDECCWEDCNQHHGSRDSICRQKIMMDAADAIEELVAQRDGLLASALELMYREDLCKWFKCHHSDTQKEAEK